MIRRFVNIYQDDNGRYISENDYESYEKALEARDKGETYIETVEIIRQENILVH
jgi:hypothetical protein